MKLKEYPGSLFRELSLRVQDHQKLGIKNKAANVPVIVSLTSFKYRLPVVSITIRCLLAQSVQPEKILLWLHNDLKTQIPEELSRLQSDRFEIRFTSLDCSHMKLVCTLQEYPEHYIVTSDDDLMYSNDWLENLLQESEQFPDSIIANECRVISYKNDGELKPYKNWRSADKGENSPGILALGYGGVIYPPGSLDETVFDETLYMGLAPKADDLWFKAMAYLKGTDVRRISNPSIKPYPIARSQKIALGKTNVKQDRNRMQWESLVEEFDIKIG